MRIRPHDLGTEWHIRLVRERARGGSSRLGGVGAPPPAPRLGPLGRAWNRDLRLRPEVAAATFPSFAEETLARAYVVGAGAGAIGLGAAAWLLGDGHVFGAALALGAGGVGGWLGAVALPRAALRSLLERPVSESEIEWARGAEPSPALAWRRLANRLLERLGGGLPPAHGDPLHRAFLDLVQEAIRCDDVPPEAEASVRAALCDLGDAVAGLPVPVGETDEAIALRQRAGDLAALARTETDGVVAASLLRQADALLREADAKDAANRQARRVRALRSELAAQIAALRAGLSALGAGRADAAVLARSADTVRGVAREAASLAAAREELDATVPSPRVAGTAAADEEQRLTLQQR